jgi:hypothetical protein
VVVAEVSCWHLSRDILVESCVIVYIPTVERLDKVELLYKNVAKGHKNIFHPSIDNAAKAY